MRKNLPNIFMLTFLCVGGVVLITTQSVTEETGSVSHLETLDPEQIDWQAKDKAYWKEVLSYEQYRVCREHGTEHPFTGKYNSYKQEGTYTCSSCGQPLFSSETKFNSGTGWPSFTQPIEEDAVELKTDRSFGMVRTEVVCNRCKAHLGHVFNDGPPPTGKRYCINSVCLLHQTAPRSLSTP